VTTPPVPGGDPAGSRGGDPLATSGPGSGVPPTGLEWVSRLLFPAGSAVRRLGPGEAVPAGFRRAGSYLVLPRAAEPRLLVPLGSARVASAALRRRDDSTSARARLGKAALAGGLRLGLTQRLMRHRVELAVSDGLSPDQRAGVLLVEHLRKVLGQPDVDVAVILGPVRLNRKPVLQVLSSEGEVVGYVKAAWNELTRRLVSNEAAVLSDLTDRPPASFAAPRLLHHGTWGELELVVASALPHTDRPQEAHRFDPPMEVLAEVAHRHGVSEGLLAESAYWKGVRARATGELGAVIDRMEDRFGRTPMRFGAWHGDFTPWNMARLSGGTYLWDWERAAPSVPLGLDLCHFLFQSVCRYEGRNAAEAVEICRQRTPDLLPLIDSDADSDDALWSCYRLELLFRYEEASRAGVLERRSRIHSGILDMIEREMEAC
jgi:hypothetical protein